MLATSRKLAEGLYGGHQPRDVALAVVLGILTGALCGFNVSWAVVLLAAVAFNVHTRLFLAAWLASLLLWWLSRRWSETIGHLLLDGTGLGQALGGLGDSVCLALLGWDQYVVVGSAATGGLMALLGGVTFYLITLKLNHRWQSTNSTATTTGPATESSGPHSPKRALLCLWYGASADERRLRRQFEPRRLRRYGVPAAAAGVLALTCLSWQIAGCLAHRELWRQLSAYNGAQVGAESSQLSLWSGQFVIRELYMADSADENRDRVRVATVKGRLSPGLLLRGHLDVEKLQLAGVGLAVARRTPAQVDQSATKTAPSYPSHPTVCHECEIELDPYVSHWPKATRPIAALGQVVAAIEQLSRAEDAGPLSARARVASRRSDLGTPRPWVMVHQLRAVDLAGNWQLGRKSLVELKDLSSNPAVSKRDAELKAILPTFGAEVRLVFAIKNGGGPHFVSCSACDLDLPQLADVAAARGSFSLAGGRARLSGEGTFDRQRIDLRLQVDVDSPAIQAAGDEPLAGIDPALWNAGMARLGTFHTDVTLAGPWSSPRLTMDRRRLVRNFEQQLQLAGANDLVGAIERQLAANELRPEPTLVVQATALEPQADLNTSEIASPQEVSQWQSGGPVAPSAEDGGDAVDEPLESKPEQSPSYAITSTPEESPVQPPPRAVGQPGPARDDSALVARRALPGPVNMQIGRDPFVNFASAQAEVGKRSEGASPSARESLMSRWSRGLRERLSRGVVERPSAPERNQASSVTFSDDHGSPSRQPIPTAASEAWHNQRWR